MNPYKKNTLWEAFILEEVVRPYQTMILQGDDRVEYLTESLYNQLYEYFIDENNKEWAHLVLDRIKRAFPEVDVSFFPEDALGFFMRHALVSLGVKVKYINFS